MKNSKRNVLLLLLALPLSSCVGSQPLFIGGAYHDADIMKNHVIGIDDVGTKEGVLLQSKRLTADTFTLSGTAKAYDFHPESEYWNGYLENDLSMDGYSRSGPKSVVPDLFKYNDGGVLKEYQSCMFDWSIASIGVDDSNFKDYFGRSNCLARIDPSFKQTGVLSKTYNGQMLCDHYGPTALVQLERSGLRTLFPKTMVSARYFMAALRGVSTDGYGAHAGTYGEADMTFRFYKENSAGKYDFYEVVTEAAAIKVDQSTYEQSFIGFDLQTLFGKDGLSGIAGYSLTFSNLNYTRIGFTTVSDQKEETADLHIGYALYETMFPSSRWN